MAKIGCFSKLLGGIKKNKSNSEGPPKSPADSTKLRSIKPEEFVISLSASPTANASPSVPLAAKTTSFDDNKVVIVDERLTEAAAYEGGDEHDDSPPMKRDFFDFDLAARAARDSFGSANYADVDGAKLSEQVTPEPAIPTGHLSDPGTAFSRRTAWAAPTLKRSCSNIETKRPVPSATARSLSFSGLQLDFMSGDVVAPLQDAATSPASDKTSRSADRVMLKKRSSSQLLPSRSRRLWWQLFLWSHRNLHFPWATATELAAPASEACKKSGGGYTSDTLAAAAAAAAADKKKKKVVEEEPENQWITFSGESSLLDRVSAWVNSIEDRVLDPDEDEDGGDGYSPYGELGSASGSGKPSELMVESVPGKNQQQQPKEIMLANLVVQSLNTLSSVAHIAGVGLKVIPAISAFTSLRAVNLSSNFITSITAGSLPKSLHALDLSRNRIAAIEGLRELTRLRVLNLSYNRISRIGHGLSNCTAIKELYLAGNKISDVEGLHRLLKLTVLDLSFNKVATAKAIGQLVANYHSLVALNLLGNPIQTNIGDEQLRKAVSGLLPKLAYLNRQPAVRAHRGRETVANVAGVGAVGRLDPSPRRKANNRRLSKVTSSSTLGASSTSKSGRSGSRSRGNSLQQSSSLIHRR